MASSTAAAATRKFRFDSFATEFANSGEEGKTEMTAMKEERPKSDICDNDSGIGEWRYSESNTDLPVAFPPKQ